MRSVELTTPAIAGTAGRGTLIGRWARRIRLGLLGSLAVLAVLLAAAVLAPVLAPYDPAAQDLANRLSGPTAEHVLGTDRFGRDVFSRLMWGGRNAFAGVAIAIAVSLAIGIPWGVVAGYWPRVIGTAMMRLADVFLAFPALVLAAALTGALGPNLVTSMVSVGVAFSPSIARLTRAGVLELREREFVLSARLSGCRVPIVMIRHLLPIALRPVAVQATIYTGLAFIIQGSLSFLGLGVQPPQPSWGADLSGAYTVILTAPHLIVAPGVLIGVVVLCVYRVGDAVRARMGSDVSADNTEGSVIIA